MRRSSQTGRSAVLHASSEREDARVRHQDRARYNGVVTRRLALGFCVAFLTAGCGTTTGERPLSLPQVLAAIRAAGFSGIRVATPDHLPPALARLVGRSLRDIRINTPDVIWFDSPHGSPYLLLRRFVSIKVAEQHPAAAPAAARIRVCNVEIDDLASAAPSEKQPNQIARDAANRIADHLRRLCERK
jgi:sugar phosphate isomerase/epimerase